MYTGTMIEQLFDVVMRAEQRAHSVKVEEPQRAPEVYAPRFFYEAPQPQRMYVGVA